MPASIALMLSRTGGPPFQGSVGYVNRAIAPILHRNGWSVRSFVPPRAELEQEAMLPFALGQQLAALDGAVPPDVALFDAAGTSVRSPGRDWARRNVVLYHGLAYGTGAWLASSAIDLHCANSPYLQRSLAALFALPNWSRRRCLNPHGLRALATLDLPVPCVEAPDGHAGFGYGVDIPAHVQAQLGRDIDWGHALQPNKQDWMATVGVMYWLNQLRPARPFKLLVSEESLDPETRRGLDQLLAPVGRRCDDYFLAVPLLHQPALYRLIRGCRFGLSYNRFPEPFGFYVLESVYNGCPVYTNGVGNNRFLLPGGHGITVLETPEMAPAVDGQQDPGAYRVVAERILADLSRTAEVGEECRAGARLIDQRWSLAAFERSLVAALDQLDAPLPEEADFESLQVQPSPLVRHLDLQHGRSLNDYGNGTLSADAAAVVRSLLGRHCHDLDSREMEQLESRHRLFSRGVLALGTSQA